MTKPRSLQILITNIVSLNPGDAAILWGMLAILRHRYGEDTQFVVSDRAAEAASRYYPWANFRQALFSAGSASWLQRRLGSIGYGHWYMRQLYARLRFASWLMQNHLGGLAFLIATRNERDCLRDYIEADLVVSTGGTYLIENYDLSANLFDYRLTLAIGKPLVFFTQTIGPFSLAKNRKAFTDVFSRAAAIFLRDEKSRRHLADLGLRGENVFLASDAAFVIEQGECASRRRSASLKVAVSVRSLRFFHEPEASGESFNAAVAKLVTVAVREFGAQVTFLSTCQGMPEYWADDSVIAADIVASLAEDVQGHVEIDREFRQPQEVALAYSGFDLVVATRMHAAILAITAGVPVVGLAYEFKMEELFSQLNMGEAVLPVKDLRSSLAEEVIRRALSDLPALRDKVSAGVPRLRKQAWSVVDHLPRLG